MTIGLSSAAAFFLAATTSVSHCTLRCLHSSACGPISACSPAALCGVRSTLLPWCGSSPNAPPAPQQASPMATAISLLNMLESLLREGCDFDSDNIIPGRSAECEQARGGQPFAWRTSVRRAPLTGLSSCARAAPAGQLAPRRLAKCDQHPTSPGKPGPLATIGHVPAPAPATQAMAERT